MKEWLNIKELAVKTGIPESSIRRYVSAFSSFFPYVGGKRSRRYDGIAVDVLLRIKALYDGGYESIGVEQQLRKDFPMVIDGDQLEERPEIANSPALLTAEDLWELKKDLQEFQNIKQELKETREELAALKEVMQSFPQGLANFEKSIKESLEKRDQLLLEKLSEKEEETEEVKESIAKPPEEEKKGFFKRFFK